MSTVPRRIIPVDSRFCPGSQFVRTSDGNCLCGQPLGAHVWAPAMGVDAFRRVTDAEHEAFLTTDARITGRD